MKEIEENVNFTKRTEDMDFEVILNAAQPIDSDLEMFESLRQSNIREQVNANRLI